MLLVVFFFFFFKQKTAYEIRKGDWSSDVCSSDLPSVLPPPFESPATPFEQREAAAHVAERRRDVERRRFHLFLDDLEQRVQVGEPRPRRGSPTWTRCSRSSRKRWKRRRSTSRRRSATCAAASRCSNGVAGLSNGGGS